MATSKNLERACAIVLIVSLLASAGLVYVKANSGESTGQTMGYESRLFDTSRVHTIDIVMDDWDSFIENCESEEYLSLIHIYSQKIAFAAIVVYRLDRISRNIGDFAKLIEDLGDRHIDFISIREQFDTSSPMGRAMMYIASVFSQLERETIAERIRDNMHELSKTGRWLGGTTPTGYASESLSSVTVDGKVKKACKLKPIPEEIQLVKTIFSVFMETRCV